MNPKFLTVEHILGIHEKLSLPRYGGAPGLRDRGLLESAVAQPQATFEGKFLHEGLFAMAAAYLFYIVADHPFVDGNKRAGLLTALTFLDLNGITIEHGSKALYELTMEVAKGRATKNAVAETLAGLDHQTGHP